MYAKSQNGKYGMIRDDLLFIFCLNSVEEKKS